jgi:hypothetical protein
MTTQSKNKNATPVDHNPDGMQLNPSGEENKTTVPPEADDDARDLDEDILMYMIHI